MKDSLPNDSDGDALRRLLATGSDLSKEMQIDFAVSVPNENVGLAFAVQVALLGFHTSVERDEEDKCWTCYCTRNMVPSYFDIINIQKTLEDLGRPFNAKPDGWGSFGNAADGAN